MKLIFCIDNKRGLAFNGRRQSRDRAVRARMLSLAAGSRLLMSPYSAGQFEDTEKIVVTSSPYDAKADDYCFIEDTEPKMDNCDELILYVWNRDYPADRYFDTDLNALGFAVSSIEDFKGYSHEKITEIIYKRIIK